MDGCLNFIEENVGPDRPGCSRDYQQASRSGAQPGGGLLADGR
jgi:hypothetical protein